MRERDERRTPEDDRRSPDRTPNSEGRPRGDRDYSPRRDRSPSRRWSQPRGGPRRGGSFRSGDKRDFPPPPEFKVVELMSTSKVVQDRQDPRSLKSYYDLDSNPAASTGPAANAFDFDFEQALADFTAGL